MPSALLVGVATAGGIITGGGPAHVKVNGIPWAVVGAAVASHGPPPHASATMAEGSHVRIDGVPACVVGDLATCGDAGAGVSHVSASP